MSTKEADTWRAEHQYSTGAVGVTVFAAILMIIGGIMQAMQGIVALINDTFFVFGKEYVFKFDVTTWGWIHLIVGAVIALAGFALLTGATWARVVAVILAGVGIIVNFLWIPYYPFWSLTIIAFDIAVIWAATMHGRDVVDD